MKWACKYIKKSDRIFVVWPINDNDNDDFPLNEKCQNYLNKKYHPLDGDIFSYPFSTIEFAPYLKD